MFVTETESLGMDRPFKVGHRSHYVDGKMGVYIMPVKKIKGAARQRYDDGVARCEQASWV